MKVLKLLIVDDVEDNRIVLRSICKKLENFEIKEAIDGIEAVEMTHEYKPHIILMDIMMPRMDGFEASKLIKKLYPDTIIIAVTAVVDPTMQTRMSQIGVDTYITKPIDKELILFKLQSIGSALRAKYGSFKPLSKKKALNPFNSDIRSYKMIFDISDSESMMDFGMWLFEQCSHKEVSTCGRFDLIVELFYKLMRQGIKNGSSISIIIEESYEEVYITTIFKGDIVIDDRIKTITQEFDAEFIIEKNILCAKLKKSVVECGNSKEVPKKPITKEIITEEKVVVKEILSISDEEKELLRQSFSKKTSAKEYVEDLGGDVVEEILDLASVDDEWSEKLGLFEDTPDTKNLINFATMVLDVYARTMNSLFEFSALAYALSSLSTFLKTNANEIIKDEQKVKTLIMLLKHFALDLSSWRENIFIVQNTQDIHYLDSSFFSSCMQIEGIICEKELGVDDENDMEFF